VVIVYMHCSDCFCTLKGSWTLSGSFVNEISCYCSGGCCGNIPCSSAYTPCQLHVYGCFESSVTHNTEDAGSKIVEAPLTLIFKIGQGGYHCHFDQRRPPEIALSLYLTYRPSDYPRCRTIHHWSSIHAHSQYGAGKVSLSVSPIKAARN